MLMIRLLRVGRTHDTSFRVVVTDKRNSTKSGRFIEILGSYDPRKGKPMLVADRLKHWLSMGAKASGTVHNLLVDAKIVEGKKVNVLQKRNIAKPAEEAKAGEEKTKESTPQEEPTA